MLVAGVLPYEHAFDEGYSSIFKREARLRDETEHKNGNRTPILSPGHSFTSFCVYQAVFLNWPPLKPVSFECFKRRMKLLVTRAVVMCILPYWLHSLFIIIFFLYIYFESQS